jgi:hypothetical protein
LALSAVFLGGIVIGAVLFARGSHQVHATLTDVTGSIHPQ